MVTADEGTAVRFPARDFSAQRPDFVWFHENGMKGGPVILELSSADGHRRKGVMRPIGSFFWGGGGRVIHFSDRRRHSIEASYIPDPGHMGS
jgi:hypothetical protein